MHIVHLEDETDLAEMLRLALVTLEPDLKVKYFPAWEKAAGYLERTWQYIDLFVIDVRLSGAVDGFEAVRKIREMGSNVPVFLTSAFERPDRDILNELDCVWVAKPWYMMTLTQQILTSVKGSYDSRANRQHQHTQDLGERTHVVASDMVQRVVEEHTKPGFVTSLDPLGKSRELMLEIHGMIEQRGVTDNFSLILGRSDPSKNFAPDIDLNLYAPANNGISRRHVRLHIEGDDLFVTDLGSTNGTFLRGERLKPDMPTPIYRGDELVLGKLALKVLFR
jgi:CheY-like chemotaxis protein